MTSTATEAVTRIYMDGGTHVRAIEGMHHISIVLSAAESTSDWFTITDPGSGAEKWVRASRVLWLEQEDEDA